jgi:hypothetical protein
MSAAVEAVVSAAPRVLTVLLTKTFGYRLSLGDVHMNALKVLISANAACLMAMLFAPASAQTYGPIYTERTLPIFPYRGMYYEAGRGGTGLTLDVDNNGVIFAVFYTYTPEGKPYYYLMQGNYQPRTDKDRLASGILGTFDATPYISEGGECVGEGCVYKSPTRTGTNLHARIVWISPRVATLTIGSQSWHLRAALYSISDADDIEGQWFFSAVVHYTLDKNAPDPILASWGSLILEKTKKNITAADFSVIPFLSPNSVIYDWTWVRIPQTKVRNEGDFFALYNPDTGRLDGVQARMVDGAIDRASVQSVFVAFPDGPQSMRGRHEYANTQGSDRKDESTFTVESDFSLSRSPPVDQFVDPLGNFEHY